jgi:hypothetical protein
MARSFNAGDKVSTLIGRERQNVTIVGLSNDGVLWIVRTQAGNMIYRTARKLRGAL